MAPLYEKGCLVEQELETYVPVNFNWVHPPGQPLLKFFERANAGNPGKFSV